MLKFLVVSLLALLITLAPAGAQVGGPMSPMTSDPQPRAAQPYFRSRGQAKPASPNATEFKSAGDEYWHTHKAGRVYSPGQDRIVTEPDKVYVGGYTRSDGTQVQQHTRGLPNGAYRYSPSTPRRSSGVVVSRPVRPAPVTTSWGPSAASVPASAPRRVTAKPTLAPGTKVVYQRSMVGGVPTSTRTIVKLKPAAGVKP